jgi:glycine C-acetyltransferase
VFGKQTQRIYQAQLSGIREAGTWKEERVIVTPQQACISVRGGEPVINFCANNYLGLSDDPTIIEAAKRTMDERGFGMSSVRFICGTLDIHKELEDKLSAFLGSEDTILYSSCFDANGGLFETLLGADDAVLSDSLNHASIIDGIRLCKAKRYRYANSDMADLEAKLREADAAGARIKLIATDGVFSMDGYIAKLDKICDLAERFDAMVMVDDSHAVGVMGATGRGTHEYRGVIDRIDIITGTLGKALGGASGGYTAGRGDLISVLRQRSRPYLFSNTLAPAVAGAAIACLDMLSGSTALRDRLEANTRTFRERMTAAGFSILQGDHPIVPIMLGDAKLASTMADALLAHGIYVIGFSFPVVPRDQARIRVQLSAAHTAEHIDQAVNAFVAVGRDLGVISA